MCLSCTIEEVAEVDLATDEGHDALAKLGRIPWPKATDEMLECAAYIAALYANPAGSTGGPLHITTDDHNVEDSSLAFCRRGIDQWSAYNLDAVNEERVQALSRWILDLLDPLDTKQRAVTISLAHGSLAEVNGLIYMPSTEFPIREEVVLDNGQRAFQVGFRSRTIEGGS